MRLSFHGYLGVAIWIACCDVVVGVDSDVVIEIVDATIVDVAMMGGTIVTAVVGATMQGNVERHGR